MYLSGDTSLNSFLFSGFTCERRDAVRTNWPTLLEKLWISQLVACISCTRLGDTPSKESVERKVGDQNTV